MKKLQRGLLPVFAVFLLLLSLAYGSPIANDDDSSSAVAQTTGDVVVNSDSENGNADVKAMISEAAPSPESAAVLQNGDEASSDILLTPATATTINNTPSMAANITASNDGSVDDSVTFVTQKAIDAYEKYNDCDPDFFDVNNENLYRSNVSLWYNEYVMNLKQDAGSYQKFGEVPLFAREMMQLSDFECNLQSKGCNAVPTCNDVTDHLKRRNLNLTTPQFLDQTRKIYFTFKQIDSITKYLTTIHELLTTTQANIVGSVLALVNDFTTQSSLESELACQLIKFGYDLALFTVDTALGVGIGRISDGAGNMVVAGSKIIFEGANPHLKKFKNYNFLIPVGVQLIKDISGATIEAKEEKTTDAWYGHWAKTEKSNYYFIMNQAYITGKCAAVGGNMPDQNRERATKMSAYVSGAFMDMRAVIEKLIKALSEGKALEYDASVLALYLHHEEMLEALQRLKKSQSAYESVMTQRFKESLITSALTSSKCYQKCAKRPGDMKAQNVCQMRWANMESRYCPEDERDLACQVQCFTTQKRGNREKSLVGKGNLKQYQLSLEALLRDSLYHYRNNGNSPPTLSQMAGNESSDVLTLDRTLGSKITNLALPVCISENVKLASFDDRVDMGKHYNRNQQFPCTCGDWTSNETADFMSRLGLGYNQSDFQTRAAKELFTEICPHNLKFLPPLSRYLAYCELGIKMPEREGSGSNNHDPPHPDYWLHNQHKIDTRRGRDAYCDIVRAQVQGKTEREGNAMFCRKETEEMKDILEDARSYAENKRGKYVSGYRKRCKEWMKESGLKD